MRLKLDACTNSARQMGHVLLCKSELAGNEVDMRAEPNNPGTGTGTGTIATMSSTRSTN